MLLAILTFVSFVIIYAMLYLFWFFIGIPVIIWLAKFAFYLTAIITMALLVLVRDYIAYPYQQWKGERNALRQGIVNSECTRIMEEYACITN